MKNIFEKYNVETFGGLVQYFIMKTSTPIEELEIKDASVYHAPTLILDKVKENEYNPMEEQILLSTTFLDAFYGISFEEVSEIMQEMGSFRTHYLFKEVLEENALFLEFNKLYENYTNRLNNLGIILIKEGKELIEKVDGFLSGLTPETITNLLAEVGDKLNEMGVLEQLGGLENN